MLGAPHSDRAYADSLPAGAVRGRGAGLNPGNRFETVRLHVLGEALDEAATENPRGAQTGTLLYDDHSRTALNPVDSPDLPMKWTFNPYRGCEHGCIYCYARPTHETLGFSCGLDFETKIVVKRQASALLRRELASPRWRGEAIMVSGVTDAYQPVEADLRLTRACMEVFAEARQPISIVTKNGLVTRDIDLLKELAAHEAVHVGVSITTLDNRLAAAMEPRASSPRERLSAIESLSAAGIPTMVMVAPVIPGLTDREAPAILKAAAEAGARSAAWVVLRLPYQVKSLFLDWLSRKFPERAAAVEAGVRGVRGGRLTQSRFGERLRGQGERSDQIGAMFALFKRRYGLDGEWPALSSRAFRPPRALESETAGDPAQGLLFGPGDTGVG